MTQEKTDSQSERLGQTYVYQHPTTGSVSASKLTVRQLCRLLCPSAKGVGGVITPQTQILAVKLDGTYDIEWKPAHQIPIFKQVCVKAWYYTVNGSTKGPFTCRELARLWEDTDGDVITENTKVYSEATDGKWIPIKDTPDVRDALTAFIDKPTGDSGAAPVEECNRFSAQEMTMDASETTTESNVGDGADVQEELQAFLKSTDKLVSNARASELEGYESDGGTRYVKDPRTGNYVHEALAPKQEKEKRLRIDTAAAPTPKPNKRRKQNKAKFAARNAKCWIYTSGLPTDTTEEQVVDVFSKVGILELDPETQRPKVKLYRDNSGKLKGDASICYARPESVELALQILHDSKPFPPRDGDKPIQVERAKFEQRGQHYQKQPKFVSKAKRKVARLAALQAVGWDEDDFNGRITGGRKGLCIVVLKHMFDVGNIEKKTDSVLEELDRDLRTECEDKCGPVEKITVFSKHPDGVVIVKFTQPSAATKAIKEYHNATRDGRKIEAVFWDGVTDYTVIDEAQEKKEAQKRHDEFGSWLEDDQQDLPEELRLKVES